VALRGGLADLNEFLSAWDNANRQFGIGGDVFAREPMAYADQKLRLLTAKWPPAG